MRTNYLINNVDDKNKYVWLDKSEYLSQLPKLYRVLYFLRVYKFKKFRSRTDARPSQVYNQGYVALMDVNYLNPLSYLWLLFLVIIGIINILREGLSEGFSLEIKVKKSLVLKSKKEKNHGKNR